MKEQIEVNNFTVTEYEGTSETSIASGIVEKLTDSLSDADEITVGFSIRRGTELSQGYFDVVKDRPLTEDGSEDDPEYDISHSMIQMDFQTEDWAKSLHNVARLSASTIAVEKWHKGNGTKGATVNAYGGEFTVYKKGYVK